MVSRILTKSNLCSLISECVYNVLSESVAYDILYRGVGNSSNSSPVLWLTTSGEYASNWGEHILSYKVSLDVLDKLLDVTNEDVYYDYLLTDTDEYAPYDSSCLDIDRMESEGHSGYYFYDDEYDCLSVCLFKSSDAELIS